MSSTISGGCGSALPAGGLFCPRCGQAAARRRSAPAVPPLPVIGMIGTSGTQVATAPFPFGPSARSAAAPPPKLRSPYGVALLIDVGPVVLLAALAAWGRWDGQAPWPLVLGPGGFAVLLLLVWLGLLTRGTSIGRACTGTSRRAQEVRAREAGQVPAQFAAPPVVARPVVTPPPVTPPVAATVVVSPAPGLIRPHRSPEGAVIASVPGSGPPVTTIASPPGDRRPMVPEPGTWSVTLDDGRALPLSRPSIFGRDPAQLPGEIDIALVVVPDETRTVSKTHVRLDPAADAVLVTDRHSTNGVVVITAGVATRCRAGEPMVAGPGSVVRFGDREMQVRRG